MKYVSFLVVTVLFLLSCGNEASDTAGKPFCDTTCHDQDTFRFTAAHKLNPKLTVTMRNCSGDSVIWTHEGLPADRQLHISTFLDRQVRLRKEALYGYVQDTSNAWLLFNDCSTGRGYLLKMPFNKKESVFKASSALNSFDPKFAVEEGLAVYSDSRSMVYVEDMRTGKKAQMTYKEPYEINFDKVHETIDSVNITRSRIFVQLIKAGQKVPLEKKITL